MTQKQQDALNAWKREIAPKDLILDPVTDTYLEETVTLEIFNQEDGRVVVFATVMTAADSAILFEAIISKRGKLTSRRIS